MSNQYHLINFAKIQFKSIEKFNTYEKKAFQIQFHSSEKVDWNIRWKHSCIFKQSVCKKKPIQTTFKRRRRKKSMLNLMVPFLLFARNGTKLTMKEYQFKTKCSLHFWQIAHFTVDKSMTVNILRHSLVEQSNVGHNVSIVVTMLKSGVQSDWQMESYQ